MDSSVTGTVERLFERDKAGGQDFVHPDMIRVGGIEKESIVDGPGFRYVVFVQGCDFRCPGCHNERLQTFEGGRETPVGELLRDIMANPLLDGLALSGGDPFTQAEVCASLAEKVRALGLSVVTFTGHLWEDIFSSGRKDWLRLVAATDILVDGPFITALRDIDLRFRGSSNQRLINVRESLAAGKVVAV